MEEFLATWRETCQGHDPDTAVSPFTILLYPLTWGLIEGTPHPYFTVHRVKMTSLCQFTQFTPANWYTPGKTNSQKINVLTQHRGHKSKTADKQEHRCVSVVIRFPQVLVALWYSPFIGATHTNLTLNLGRYPIHVCVHTPAHSGKRTSGAKHL